jgi:hypothetical protein
VLLGVCLSVASVDIIAVLQENYIKVRPAVSRAEVEACGGDQLAASAARCAAAADALSDLDLVDRTLMSTQSWSLLPLEACLAVSAGAAHCILLTALLLHCMSRVTLPPLCQVFTCAACLPAGSTAPRLQVKPTWAGSFPSFSGR